MYIYHFHHAINSTPYPFLMIFLKTKSAGSCHFLCQSIPFWSFPCIIHRTLIHERDVHLRITNTHELGLVESTPPLN